MAVAVWWVVDVMDYVADYYTGCHTKGQIVWISTGFAFTISFIRLKNSF